MVKFKALESLQKTCTGGEVLLDDLDFLRGSHKIFQILPDKKTSRGTALLN